MSTRCNIIVKDRWNNRVYLYHHHDGYPEFVGACLAEMLAGMQPWQIKQHPFSIANKLVKNGIQYQTTDWRTHEPKVVTDDEYEITSGVHGDIEYLYVINGKAGTLRCYAVDLWEDAGEENGYAVNIRRVIRRSRLCEIPGWDKPAETDE